MIQGLEQQKIAVDTGHYPHYRYTPAQAAAGKNPLQLDSKAPSLSLAETAVEENRVRQLRRLDPSGEAMLQKAEAGFRANLDMLQALAELPQK